jgi:cytochrome P450
MIAYPSLGARRIVPYTSASLSLFLNSPNYIKPPRASNFIRILIGEGIVVAEYDEHKRQRRILTPAFGVTHIRQITPHFWMKANQLAEEWRPIVEAQPENGIDVMKWMNRVTLDIIGLAGCPQVHCG